MKDKAVRIILKVSHLIRPFIRRYLWIKVLASLFLLFLIIKMNRDDGLQTLYEYYNIQSGERNIGLSDENENVFKLNGKDMLITSGTIHYFRVHPDYWRDRLRKLRAMGALAVETYMPWNLHEPKMDVFDFGDKNYEMSKFLDIVKFLTIAKEEDLFVILRPGPYICAEWEFGGLPSYLLGLNANLRTSDGIYMKHVEKYLKEVIARVSPFQVYNGGPIIMVQIENEYGSLNDLDHEYMVQLRKIMMEQGLKGLFFTADSPIPYESKGSLADFGVLQTANFKEKGQMQLEALKELQPSKPPMVMEFWTGWFDHWDEPIHNTWSVTEYITALEEILNFPASVNLYVFHGGTTFGFLNGANVNMDGDPDYYHPDITSYDYDALVSENGDYTEKYFKTQKLFLKAHKNLRISYPSLPVVYARTLKLSSLITEELTWDRISDQMPPYDMVSDTFVYMEDLSVEKKTGQSFGFIHYGTTIHIQKENSSLQIKGPIRDIVIVLLNGIRQTEILSDPSQLNDFGFFGSRDAVLTLKAQPGIYTLEYMVENCGRTNYVRSLSDFPKKKGLGSENEVIFEGIDGQKTIKITGLSFSSEWITSLTDWSAASKAGELTAPGLFKTTFIISSEKLSDTYLDIRKWRKGVVYVNGFNIGRYFSGGPQLTLYIPAPLLRVGENTIIIFEQYVSNDEINLVTEPIFA